MLTTTDKTLAKIFSQKQMNEHNAIGVMVILREEKAENKMLDYLKTNPEATEKEIIDFSIGLQKMTSGTDR